MVVDPPSDQQSTREINPDARGLLGSRDDMWGRRQEGCRQMGRMGSWQRHTSWDRFHTYVGSLTLNIEMVWMGWKGSVDMMWSPKLSKLFEGLTRHHLSGVALVNDFPGSINYKTNLKLLAGHYKAVWGRSGNLVASSLITSNLLIIIRPSSNPRVRQQPPDHWKRPWITFIVNAQSLWENPQESNCEVTQKLINMVSLATLV